MPYASTLEATAARAAISKGDDQALERYLREGVNNPVLQTLTGATGVLIPGVNLINKPTGGFNYTLPNAIGSQDVVKAILKTTLVSGTTIIRTAKVTDFMLGMMVYGTQTFAAGSTEHISGTDALLTLTAAAGGLRGTILNFTDIEPNYWLVEGYLASTTPATIAGVWA